MDFVLRHTNVSEKEKMMACPIMCSMYSIFHWKSARILQEKSAVFMASDLMEPVQKHIEAIQFNTRELDGRCALP